MDFTSPKNYLDLFNYFYYAIHPAVFVFGFLGIFLYRKKIIENKVVRFLAVFLVFDLLLKNVKFWNTGMLTERYVLIFVFIFNIFISIFCIYLYKLIQRHKMFEWQSKKYSSFNTKNIFYAVVMTTLLVMVGQNFNPAFNKPWIRGVAEYAKNGTQCCDRRYVVLSNSNDARIGFYLNAEQFIVKLPHLYVYRGVKFNSDDLNTIKLGDIKQVIRQCRNNTKVQIFLFLEKIPPAYLKKIFRKKYVKKHFKLIREFEVKGKEKKSYLYKYI